ncbi:MAG: SpoIIE family protein phosphatase [Desulfobacteraceae bacterium]|nr:SpoIIE family protein phosphatase [Desulfobacteraceae bacterium]
MQRQILTELEQNIQDLLGKADIDARAVAELENLVRSLKNSLGPEPQPDNHNQGHCRNCAAFKEILQTASTGQIPKEIPGNMDSADELLTYLKELQGFAFSISKGDLSYPLKIRGPVAGSFKALQASLRHLAWQTKMIAGGDLSQRVDFMGEFSDSFNTMVDKLQEARTSLNEKNKELETLNQKLEKSLYQLEQRHLQLEDANKRIMDNVQYAQRIQGSFLPNQDQVKKYLPDSFFLWIPRDIVSGDMYYVYSAGDGFIVAVVDCTGHGVSGAFITMIASTALQRIIIYDKCCNPGEILNRLNFIVKTSLKQDTELALSDDGMDACVCHVRYEQKILEFAGARHNLITICNDVMNLIKGDKQNIGYKRSDLNYIYTCHTVHIDEGMGFYLYTDGFADQIGGSKDKRFGTRRFKDMLMEHSNKPFEEQGQLFLEVFDRYEGNNERRDDVTVVGFRM